MMYKINESVDVKHSIIKELRRKVKNFAKFRGFSPTTFRWELH